MLIYDLPEVRKFLFQILRLRIGTSAARWQGTVEGEYPHFNHMITALGHFQEHTMDQFLDLQDTVIFELSKCKHLPRLAPIVWAFFNTHEEPPNQWDKTVRFLRIQIFKLADKHEVTAKEYFLQKHQEQFEKDKKNLFGFFSTTEIHPYMSLKEILQHGQSKNNRTRRICTELDWMTPEGELTANAPGFHASP